MNIVNQIGVSENDSAFNALAKEIQGNIVKAHGREHVSLIFFRFNKDKEAESRAFIVELAEKYITTAYKQKKQIEAYRQKKSVDTIFIGFYLSSSCYEYLQIPASKRPIDNSFSIGMKQAGANLKDPPASTWEDIYREEINGIILLAGSSDTISGLRPKILDIRTQFFIKKLKKNNVAIVLGIEKGNVMKNNNNDSIEHFGYVDGLSQPKFFTEEVAQISRDQWDPLMAMDLVLVRDRGVNGNPNAFGSYFVYRKLEQNVKKFKETQKQLAIELFGDTDADNELAGAMVVGRFKNGMPVVLSEHPNSIDGQDMVANEIKQLNNFNYSADQLAGRCPFHSHIRKVNPRGESRENIGTERKHAIVRRGIVYDKRPLNTSTNMPPDELPSKDVGLLFMSFQASIANQFEFIQQIWANDSSFPKDNVGRDGIIGQGNFPDGLQKYPTEYGNPNSISGAKGFGNFVTLKGGEYFFAPSMSFLLNLNDMPPNSNNTI